MCSCRDVSGRRVGRSLVSISTAFLAETAPDLLLFRLPEASCPGPAEGSFHSRSRKSVHAARAVSECVAGVHNGGPRLARDSGWQIKGSWMFHGCELSMGMVATKNPRICVSEW